MELPTNPYVTHNLGPIAYTINKYQFYHLMYNISTTRTYLHKVGYWKSMVNNLFDHTKSIPNSNPVIS